MTSSRDCVCADTLRTDVKINAVAKKICFIGTISFVIKAKGRDWVCETTTRCKAELARPRTFPQHTLPLLPLLRSRPGGVHKASVVRSPGSDKTSKIVWRRGWDSNPRNGFPFTAFPVLPVQPLLHLSWISHKKHKSHKIFFELFMPFVAKNVAERVGFEPTVGVNPLRFSRPVH